MRNDKRIELKLWLIVALIIGLAVLAGNVFGQIDITKRTVTLDSLRSRGGDTIWITNKTGGLAWLRVNQDDSLFFGDGTGEYSFGEQYETDTIKTTFIWINDSTYIDSDGSYYYTGETFYNGMYGTTNNGAEGAIYTYASDNGDTAVVSLYTYDADEQQMSILIDRSGIYYDESTVPETFGENHLITKSYLDSYISGVNSELTMFLPDTIWAVSDIEMNIYYDNIISGNRDNYNVYVNCPIGNNYTDYYRVTADSADAGAYELIVELRDVNNTTLIKDTLTLIVSNNTIVTDYNILLIGDSQIDQNLIPYYLDSLTGKIFNFIGTNDIGSDTPHEGYVGRTAKWFATDTASPFVINEELSFSAYLDENELDTPNIVVINLGTNDVINSTNSSILSDIDTSLSYIDSLLKYINIAMPDAKVYVNTIMPPSYYQDAFASYNGGSTRTKAQVAYNFNNYNAYLKARYANTATTIIPTYVNLDTKNNMKSESVQVNARNSTMIKRQNDAVHPDSSGYFQIADVIFSTITAKDTAITGFDVIGLNNLDGGFENCSGCTPDDGNTDNWAMWGESTGTGGKVELTETNYIGNYACKITRGTSNANVSLSIPCTENTNYRVTFYTRGDGSNDGGYRMYDLTNTADILSPAIKYTGIYGTDYQLFTFDFTTPTGCENVRLYLYSDTVEGSVIYFDAVDMRQVY